MPTKSLPRLSRFILKNTSLTNHSISIGMYEWYVYYFYTVSNKYIESSELKILS